MMSDWAWRGSNVRVAPRSDALTGLAVLASASRRPSWNQRLGRYSHKAAAEETLRRELPTVAEIARKAPVLHGDVERTMLVTTPSMFLKDGRDKDTNLPHATGPTQVGLLDASDEATLSPTASPPRSLFSNDLLEDKGMVEHSERLSLAQQAVVQAREQGAVSDDETFRHADALFQHNAEQRSAVRGLLLRMARGSARVWEAQEMFEQETSTFVSELNKTLARRSQAAQLLADRRTAEIATLRQDLEFIREELRLVDRETQSDAAREAAEEARRAMLIRQCKEQAAREVSAVVNVLRPEMLAAEQGRSDEVAAYELQLEAQWTFSVHKTEELSADFDSEMASLRKQLEDEVARAKAETERRAALENERLAKLQENLGAMAEDGEEAKVRLADMMLEQEAMADKWREAEVELRKMIVQSDEEAVRLRAEVFRLRQVLEDALAAGSLEALKRESQQNKQNPAAEFGSRRSRPASPASHHQPAADGAGKQNAALLGKGRKIVYRELLRRPVDTHGHPQDSAISWRGTLHAFVGEGAHRTV